MPHDAKGTLLKVGDVVMIPGVVVGIHPDERYCNCDVELEYPMPAYPDQKQRYSAISTRQVVKVNDGKIYPCGCRAFGSPDLPDYCPEHQGNPDDPAPQHACDVPLGRRGARDGC